LGLNGPYGLYSAVVVRWYFVVTPQQYTRGNHGQKKGGKRKDEPEVWVAPVVAATLAGVIYQARLQNRQAKLNIPEQEVISDVVSLWHR